jgi:hypothetical protein
LRTSVVSKGLLNIDPRREPFETAKSLQYPPLLFGKPSAIVPSISQKMKGRFARKKLFPKPKRF